MAVFAQSENNVIFSFYLACTCVIEGKYNQDSNQFKIRDNPPSYILENR